jgi:glycosyltransferase involved in cell wall biosynthesis
MSLPRVLVAHNSYQQRGGEDTVVEAEIALLRRHGHEVELLARHNDEVNEIGRAAMALQTIWSRRTRSDARTLIRHFRPDVVHVHNTFPLISPSLYWSCEDAGVPVVQTLHNFRIACPQAMLLREGKVCEDCLGRLPLPAVRHGCYRGSRSQTAVLASMIALHRGIGTWQRKVTLFIALNEFCRRKFVQAGLPEDRLVVKPNFVEAPALTDGPRDGFLLVGRLSEEKGLRTLAQAWQGVKSGTTLRVAGEGPLDGLMAGLNGVELLGMQSLLNVQGLMTQARALVLPSIWYENFPRTLVEAFGAGLPVIASRIGALAELVTDGETGLLFEPGNTSSLVERIEWARLNPAEMARMGRRAREVYDAEFTPERNHEQLMAIYRLALARHT